MKLEEIEPSFNPVPEYEYDEDDLEDETELEEEIVDVEKAEESEEIEPTAGGDATPMEEIVAKDSDLGEVAEADDVSEEIDVVNDVQNGDAQDRVDKFKLTLKSIGILTKMDNLKLEASKAFCQPRHRRYHMMRLQSNQKSCLWRNRRKKKNK